MNALISVIVPCYNVEVYLPRCIESILAQTYTSLEILLIDDGSPDRCGEICEDYARRDRRIKVIHKENGGLSDARNAGLDAMKGEYVVFVDSDDYIAPTHVADLYRLLADHGAQIAVHNPCPFAEDTLPQPKAPGAATKVFAPLEALETMFYQADFDTTAWGKMYLAALFEGVRYPKGLLYEDLPTTYRLLLRASRVAYADVQSYYYLHRPDSIERASFSEKKLESCLAVLALLEQDADRFRPIAGSYRCRAVSFAFHILLEMPRRHPRRHLLESRIGRWRWSVLCDAKARRKTRLACGLSYLGYFIVQTVFLWIKSLKSKLRPA